MDVPRLQSSSDWIKAYSALPTNLYECQIFKEFVFINDSIAKFFSSEDCKITLRNDARFFDMKNSQHIVVEEIFKSCDHIQKCQVVFNL